MSQAAKIGLAVYCGVSAAILWVHDMPWWFPTMCGLAVYWAWAAWEDSQ
jgi:hypothetical protein